MRAYLLGSLSRKSAMRAQRNSVQLVLLVLCWYSQIYRGEAGSCGASTSFEDFCSCIQVTRIGALRTVFNSAGSHYAAADAYLHRQQQLAKDLLAFLSLVKSPRHDDDDALRTLSGGLRWHTEDSGKPVASKLRQLLQLSDTSTGSQLSGARLTSTTSRDTRLVDVSGTIQAASNDFSTSTTAINQDLLQRIAQDATERSGTGNPVLDLLMATSNINGDNVGPATPEVPAVAAMGGAPPAPAAMRQQPSMRIIGGVEAPTDRKYVCSLRTTTNSNSDFLYCGCSLISPTVVMTAAHCLASANLRTPWVEIGRYYQQQPNSTGVNDYDRIKCAAGVPNRSWSESSAQNDVALCFLESPSRFTPVKLGSEANTKLTTGQELTVMGWGATSEGGNQASSLMTVDVATTDLRTCSQAYDITISGDTQICAGVPAGGKDACQGDSGGPLIVKGSTAADDVQVGIVSFGIGCGHPNIPGVYTDVRAFRQWIGEQMLARGVSYAPLTDGCTAPANTVDQTTACACTTNGISGGVNLGSSLAGCKQHGLSMGDREYYCYTRGGTDCTDATQSNTYPGAAWIACTPDATKTEGDRPSNQERPSNQNIASTPSSDLLASWLGSWLPGLAGRGLPANVTVNGTAPVNVTRRAATSRSAGLNRRVAPAAVTG